MKILIDIGHPAHVHLFKNFAKEMIKKGHKIHFTTRDKEFELYLLKINGFKFESFGKKYVSKIGKIIGLLEFNYKLLKIALKFNPDIFLSHGSIYAAHIAFLLRKPHISLEDTFNFEQIKLYKPFTKVILSGNYKHPYLGEIDIKYNGYHELAYLHPAYFKAEELVLDFLGVVKGEKYVILRFVAWEASHDYGHSGITQENKLKIVNEFSKYAKVFISSEKKLPVELNKYQIQIPPEKMHDAIAFSSLVFGESATMISEAAVLGVPGIYLDNSSRYYTQDQEINFGLVYNFSESLEDQQKAMQKGVELLKKPNLLAESKQQYNKMLEDKIDVTAFLVWFVENYPESLKIMKKTPEYQNNFK